MTSTSTDSDIRALARELVTTTGPKAAAKALRVGRDTALNLAAGGPVRPGTFALIRERARAGETQGGGK